ncbi:DM13 domain-containing protein [Paenibacillus sp. GCM10023250]|uniref:DM13 domain-containing protein n=1 Tax=Paenibacillus sp. GCM10023250 TaxID=3252648 RepID=UPI00360A9549
MKKNVFLSAGIIVVLSLALAACGKAGTPASNGSSSSSTTAGNSTSSDMTAGTADSGDDMAAASGNMSSRDDMTAADASEVKLMGTFEGQNEMKAAGTAVIENGQLKLSNFSVSEGPDLHVYLANGNDAANGTEIGKIDLKSAEQTFDVTKEDLSKYDTVLIYCQKAHVIFGKASLEL